MIGAKPNLKAAREAQKAAEAKSKAATGSTTTTTTTGTMSTANMGNYFFKVSLIVKLSHFEVNVKINDILSSGKLKEEVDKRWEYQSL